MTGEAAQDRVRSVRGLAEGEKLSLIFSQQRKVEELEDHLSAIRCAHQSGQCVLCSDKDSVIAAQQAQIHELKKRLFGRSSERRKKGSKKPKGNPKKPSETRTRLPSAQFPNARVQEETLTDGVAPTCNECQESMVDSGLRETAERLEYIPEELYILRTHRVRYRCNCCQSAPQTVELLARLAPGTSLGDSLIIQACVSKFYDLIPTTRFAKMLARTQVDLSEKMLRRGQNIMTEVMYQAGVALKQEISTSRVVHADETTHRMLEQNNGQWRWWLWAFATQTSVYFEIHDTRAGEVSIEFLKISLAVFLVSDAYSGYSRTQREVNEYREKHGLPLLESSLCNDHARRYFVYASEHPLAEKVLDQYERIYAIEAKVQELLKNPKYIALENTSKALELRQSADVYFEVIHGLSCEILLDSPEKAAEAVAANYFLTHVEGLTRFLKHIELPISNAPAERSIRSPVVLRKTSLGTHSQEGAETAALHLSLMGSCKLNEINPTEYYQFSASRYLERQPLLTPFQYKQHLEKKKRGPP
jgi:transposase